MEIQLENFAGPLDLLLHLIKKHEVDIYDIPIALITRQYLEYLELIKTLNLEIAGDFLVMAATLAQIKSRMLLPVQETADGEAEGPDPRQELVNRLLEYKKYKGAAEILEEREGYWGRIFQRETPEVIPDEVVEPEASLFNFGLFDLVSAFQGILRRHPQERRKEIIPEKITVKDKIEHIMRHLEFSGTLEFASLFEEAGCREEVIVTFLAILELVKQRLVRVAQIKEFGAIYIMQPVIT